MYPPTTNHHPPTTIPPRRGFTLTELLVVIAIIAMLVALTSVAVMRAMGTAKQTRIKVEIDQLDAAMKAYKERYGAYPPCDLQTTGLNFPALRQHVARAFPRYDMGTGGATLIADLGQTGVDTAAFRPDQALTFWLRGFSPDPSHPFVSLADHPIINGTEDMTVTVKRSPLYGFDASRLAAVDNTGTLVPNTVAMPSYFPAGAKLDASGAPYVYFAAATYGALPVSPSTEAVPNTVASPFTSAGVAAPYWNDVNGLNASLDFDGSNNPIETWVNPESFQIISAGSDGKYGGTTVVRCYPTGTNYDVSAALADDDNVTNFCGNARLGDAKP
ncbi:MAG: prepilin-type N-terminal cleavage/methylation domain-containing protein [Pirellulales bacterium]